MALPKILYEDLSIVAYSASQQTASGFDVTNLQDYAPDTYWKSSASSSQELYITFDNSTACSAIALIGHNFDSISSTIIVQVADNAAFTTNVTNVVTLIPVSSDIYYVEFVSVNKKYWRIKLPATTVLPYVGTIYLGTPLLFPYTYDWDYKKDNFDFDTTKNIGLSGNIITSQPYNGREILELQFKFLDATYRNQFISFVKQVRGDLYPFVFIDHESISRYCAFQKGFTPLLRQLVNVNDWNSVVLEGITTKGIIADSKSIVRIVDYDYIGV